MHHHCEVILPAGTIDIESAVASVMAAFDENREESDDHDTRHAFWDWYVIGGRWAGSKLMAGYDQDKLAEFEQWLTDSGVTVAGLRCGKQELSPASQIPTVDAKWNETFPPADGIPVACPMFNHSNDQYAKNGNGTIAGDVGPLIAARGVKCNRVIFAGPSWDRETSQRTGPLEAVFMLVESQWNGVNHMPVKWDQTVGGAIEQFSESLANYADAYREQMAPTDESIAVTVDYHS